MRERVEEEKYEANSWADCLNCIGLTRHVGNSIIVSGATCRAIRRQFVGDRLLFFNRCHVCCLFIPHAFITQGVTKVIFETTALAGT